MILACFLKRTALPEREWSWFISINPLLTWSTQSLQDMKEGGKKEKGKRSIQSGHSAHSLPSTTHGSSISQVSCVTCGYNETSRFKTFIHKSNCKHTFASFESSINMSDQFTAIHLSLMPIAGKVYIKRRDVCYCFGWFLHVYWNVPFMRFFFFFFGSFLDVDGNQQ